MGSLVAKVHALFEDPAGVQFLEAFLVGCIVERTELVYTVPTRVKLSRQWNTPTASAAFAVECKQLTQREMPTRLVVSDALPPYLEIVLDRNGSFEPMESSDTRRVRATGVLRLVHTPPPGVLLNALRLEAEFPDGQPRVVDLAVELVDSAHWQVDPPALYLGSVLAGNTVVRRVSVRSPLLLSGLPPVRCSGTQLDATWESLAEGDGVSPEGRTLRVQYTSPGTSGPFEAWIELDPDGEAHHRIAVGGIAR
jgi:hypothetical protein